jgi:hypothetical protein
MLHYFQNLRDNPQFHRFTFGVADMPLWARLILLIFTIPGILLLVLSFLAVGVSILALLLLTVPVYLLLKKVTGVRSSPTIASRGAKRVEATVRDA